MNAEGIAGDTERDIGRDIRLIGLTQDVKVLMGVLTESVVRLSRTVSWEQVAMGVNEIRELARCSFDFVDEAQRVIADGARAASVSPGDTIIHMQTLLRAIAGSDLELRYDIETVDARAALSAVAVEQLVVNLVANAQKTGATIVGIAVQAADGGDQQSSSGVVPGRYVTICVSDNGAGMNEAALAKLNDCLKVTSEQEDPVDELATVIHLVHSVNGSLSVRRNTDGGLTVEARLPRATDD